MNKYVATTHHGTWVVQHKLGYQFAVAGSPAVAEKAAQRLNDALSDGNDTHFTRFLCWKDDRYDNGTHNHGPALSGILGLVNGDFE